jgi:hypothetical protein
MQWHLRRERTAEESLPDAAVLAAELQDFRASISEAGFASFGARAGKQDDLVLALAIACWWMLHDTENRATVKPLNL